MRTKLLLKAKKFFIDTFAGTTFPEKKDVYEKMMDSSFIPLNPKIMFSTLYTKDLLEDFFSKKLTPFSITLPQFEIIKTLYFSKELTLTQDDLRKYLFVSKANISSLLTKLEHKNLIERKENKLNKRQKLISLTKNGEELLYTILDTINPFQMTSFLTKSETKTYIELNKKIHSSLEKLDLKMRKEK